MSDLRFVWLRLVVVACILLVCPAVAWGQATGATLLGTVSDQQGAVLPGATIVVTNTETGWTRTLVTDARGLYRAAALPPGAYELKVEMSGFVTQVRSGMTLTIGQEVALDVTLQLATLQETVTVTSAAPLVETTKSTVGTTITRSQLDSLPIAARNFTALASLTPGVTSVGGGGLNAGGQLSRNNTMLIDGASNNEVALKSQRGGFSLEAVREYVVIPSQFAAEYGNASGAIISVVTRSGTNQIQGRGFVLARNDQLDAQNPFSHAQGSGKAPFSQQRFGGFVGGPVKKDQLHYFASYEGLRQRETSVITSPLVPVSEREVPFDVDGHQVFVKFDWQTSQNQSLSVRYRLDNNESKGNGIGGFSSRELGYDLLNRNQDAGLNHTWIVSDRALNEFRAIYSPTKRWYDVTGYAASPNAPLLSYPSGSFGKSSNQPQGDIQWYLQLINNFSYTVGRHSLKAGVSFNIIRDKAYFLGNKDGTFLFASDTPVNPADPKTYPYRYTRNIGDWLDPEKDEIYAGFVQDTWRVNSRVTLNLGLRYDLETAWAKANYMRIADASTGFAPKEGKVPNDTNNFSPRVGFAWDPLGDGKSAVRGGYGLYYDQTFLNITGNISVASKSVGVQINNPGYPDPYAGGSSVPVKPNTTVAAPDIQVPQTQTLSLGVKRELMPGLALSADYINTRGTHLFNAHDVNYPVAGVRPNPNFNRITRYETTGHSWSNALLVSLERRGGRGPGFGISYTLSKAERDVEDFGSTAQDQNNPAAEKSRANNDRRHQVVGNVTWMVRWGVQVAALVSARTGRPWNITTGKDNNGDSNSNDRPDLVNANGEATDKATYYSGFTGRVGDLPRNWATGPGFLQIDLRLSKFVRFGARRLEIFAEGFNLANRANLGNPTGSLSSSVFGRSTGVAGDPRQVEVGFRFDF